MEAIFVHGLGQTPESWGPVLDCLGRSANCPSLPRLLEGERPDYARLYENFSRYCQTFSGSLWLCGLSLGGILAMNFAIDQPERVHALTLIGVQYKMPKGMLRVQNALFRLMPRRAFGPMGFEKEAFLGLCRSMMDLDFTEAVQKISCPALAACGEKDQPNRKAAEDLAKALPRGTLTLVPGAGHECNVSHPQQLAAAIAAWQNFPAPSPRGNI